MDHDHDELHDSFFSRKERKAYRKIASKTDRSKFKKTDAKKERVLPPKKNIHLKRGRVLSIAPETITVDLDGVITECSLKGVLKKEFSRAKNLVVVGDFVRVDAQNAICEVEKRGSQLLRKGTFHQKKHQIIASNIDQVLITVSAKSPPLKPAVIDRFIIAAKKGNMLPVIVITKIDLLEKEELLEVQKVVSNYRSFGFCVILLSVLTREGMHALEEQMRFTTSVFAGESGVGKSSLINALTGLQLPTKPPSEKTQRGVHTTVGAKLIPLSCGGFCIDTPGIQNFGLWELQKGDLEEYFEEIFETGRACKYPDCSHVKEENCAVKKAVEAGDISKERYLSYCNLLRDIGREAGEKRDQGKGT